ncbi:unnamed protein product, partial [Ectocarpus fasciculatus]
LLYRITGPQSIERLNPLLQLISKPHDSAAPVQWRWAEDSDTQLSFVWETACEKAWRDRHLQAGVLNRLNNSQVLEDKSNLAYLQLNMTVPVLETFIARCPDDFRRWADNRWSPEEPGATGAACLHDISDSLDWWAVKAARGNGGKDVWITNRDNYADTFAQLPRQGELVIQKYVDRPLLWKGKKFHLRCYSMIMADLTALVYEKCYILTAGKDYQTDTADISSHITNLSVNKHIPGYPGQVPCDLPTEFPEAFENVCKLWESVVSAASDFMKEQQNENNFEFYGIDVIVDVDQKCWLIEINRLPGLESSNLNKDAEDSFYNEMMLSVLQMVTKPLLS